MLLPPPLGAITLGASSEHASHPVTRLLEETPRLRWQSASSSVTSAGVSVTCTQAVTSLVITGAVCTDCGLSVGGGAVPGITKQTVTDPYTGKKGFWFTFTSVSALTTITATFTQLGSSTISAEQLLVGATGEYTGVQYPVAEGLVDSSVITPMSDGTIHVRQRPIGRAFAAGIRQTTAVIRSFLRTSRGIGRQATMFHLSETTDPEQWLVYGRFAALPQGSHDLPTLSVVQFSIEEAV
ncbi:MAG: hypothetical protein RBU35_22250 [Anaerolineae bacterium]|jgi:hypothetical protein|nr:hypothetical protein [Anaerolineae bacterium]